ncbi:MAG: hypothetical protein JXB38_12485 [Anaerolineales bacterium]|nr:hypothetical protein [Anaerolineales bacterium]
MKKRRIYIAIVAILSVLILCSFMMCKFNKMNQEVYERHLQSTAPLDTETVLDLCEKLDLEKTDPLCDLEVEIYAVDYAQVLYKRLNVETTTFDDVDEILGDYTDECYTYDSGITGCRYDLKGDGKFLCSASFDERGLLEEFLYGWYADF